MKCLLLVLALSLPILARSETYRYFEAAGVDGRITALKPLPSDPPPRWAREVSQEKHVWPEPKSEPFFAGPVAYVISPRDAGEAFHKHNHCPSLTWLANGDLLAIWYSTDTEPGTELTILASRLRAGNDSWDPSSVFFKATDHNMHGSAIFHDGQGTIHHFNGMGPAGVKGWNKLALLHRSSADNGLTWSAPEAVSPDFQQRNQVISGTLRTRAGILIQPCDAVPGGAGGTALWMTRDGGKTWSDAGAAQPTPSFADGTIGKGTIAGIHAGIAELKDGSLLALGRGDSINARMPMSVSKDLGETWSYSASPFPPISGGQRLVLCRLREGPLLLVSFTNTGQENAGKRGMEFSRADGSTFFGYGLYAALSEDDGKTWQQRKLITPGSGSFDGGAWTGKFTAAPDTAEHAGYLAFTQTPDGTIHLISSRLYYRFNFPWLKQRAN